MNNIKQQLKLMTAVFSIVASSFVMASPLGNFTVKGSCDTTTKYCVYIKADNTVSNDKPLKANVFYTLLANGQEYKDSAEFQISQSRGVLFPLDVEDAKQNNVTDVTVGVDKIDGIDFKNCVIKASGDQIKPGSHSITLYRSNGGVGCQTTD